MKRIEKIFLILLGTVIFTAGCKKYDIAPQIADPAYIRVFNDLTTTIDAFNSAQAPPFLTFLLDPKTSTGGIPTDAAIIGDHLTTRQLYSKSFPINEANSSIGNGTIGLGGSPDAPVLYPQNYEYPGNAPVLAAPVINGFDLSSWAQISSGQHRIMFVVRPQTITPFKALSEAQRSSVLLDTTINFEKGEVYTLEVISRDLDKSKYGLYVRKENFIHQAFDENKIYTGFVNLSGKTPADAAYGNGTGFYFPAKVKINCTYNIPNDAASTPLNPLFSKLPGYNNIYLTTLTTTMAKNMDYFSFPSLPSNSFFRQGILRSYSNPLAYYVPDLTGNMPYVGFTFVDADKPVLGAQPVGYPLDCSANPSTFNNFNVNTTISRYFQPTLNLLVNINGTYHAYATLNIMELVYDRVYMMQIKRGINDLPTN